MNECAGKYFIYNSEIKENKEFCDDFLKREAYIYEVIRVVDFIPLFVEDHVKRLKQTADIQNTCLPYPENEIIKQIKLLIEKNNFNFGNVKIVYLPDTVDNTDFDFLVYIQPHEYPTEEDYEKGVGVSIYQAKRDNPNAKIMNTILREKTKKLKISTNTYETLLINDKGYVTECSRSNIYFIKNDYILTPPGSDVLHGITREKIMMLCNEMGISIKEQKIKHSDLNGMDAVFISGTSRKILPVNKIDGNQYHVDHIITRKIQKAFDDLIEKYIISAKLQ